MRSAFLVGALALAGCQDDTPAHVADASLQGSPCPSADRQIIAETCADQACNGDLRGALCRVDQCVADPALMCCDGRRWARVPGVIEQAQQAEPAPPPPEAGPADGAAHDAASDARSEDGGGVDVTPDGGVDLSVPPTCEGYSDGDLPPCTAAAEGLTCSYIAQCGNGFPDPGNRTYECAGGAWSLVFEDGEVCGFPEPPIEEEPPVPPPSDCP